MYCVPVHKAEIFPEVPPASIFSVEGRHYVLPKLCYWVLPATLHGIIFQVTVLLNYIVLH
jgi:hypothetical protein